MDYVTMPASILSRCDPIRRQLLGDAVTQLGYWLPTDDDAPLKAWQRQRDAEG
jgi:hypothetical protein